MPFNDFDYMFQEIRQGVFIDENDFLREKHVDMEKLYTALRLGDGLLLHQMTEGRAKYILYRKLSYIYRLVGCIATALYYIKEALSYFKTKGGEDYLITLINYGETVKHARRYNEALAAFQEALELSKEKGFEKYEDSVWQFKGKCYLEQGDISNAERCFYKAYTLRKERHDEELLVPSERALQYIAKIKR